MALDMFLELGTVKGESRDKVYAGKIDILAWSWGASNAGSGHVGGGSGAGKANFQDITITKYIDLSSSELLQSVAQGTHFDKARIIVRKSGGTSPIEYFQVMLEQVFVSSYSTGGSGGEDRLTENITLNYAVVQTKYQAQDAKGAKAGDTKWGWNVAENTEKKPG